VLEGFHPESGRYLGLRYHDSRRAGWDIVVSPHKTVSVAALCCRDESLRALVRNAWDRATLDTFPLIERLGCSHYQGTINLPTGGLIAAAFTHFRSRHGDPMLHTHLVVANATPCLAHPDTWRSLEPSPIFRHSRLLDVALQRELLRHLRDGGLDARLDERQRVFLPGILPSPTLRRLSKAKEAIDVAEELSNPAPLTLAASSASEPISNRASYRSRLNDRLRPPKQPVDRYPLFDSMLDETEHQQVVSGLIALKSSFGKAPAVESEPIAPPPLPSRPTQTRQSPGKARQIKITQGIPASSQPDRSLGAVDLAELRATLAQRFRVDYLFTTAKSRFREWLEATERVASRTPLADMLPALDEWGRGVVFGHERSGVRPESPLPRSKAWGLWRKMREAIQPKSSRISKLNFAEKSRRKAWHKRRMDEQRAEVNSLAPRARTATVDRPRDWGSVTAPPDALPRESPRGTSKRSHPRG
jgi:conjugative relaxase-like TrwC/TraI family protein